MGWTRRTFLSVALAGSGAGGLALLLPKRHRRQDVDLESLVDAISRSSTGSVLAVAASALSDGASAERLLGAAFLAPILTGGDGEDIHAILAIPSILQCLATRGSRAERLMPTLWGVWNVRSWTGGHRTARPAVGRSVGSNPALALTLALESSDSGKAEEAVSSLLRVTGVTATAACLRVEASRCRADPHGAIYAAHGTRLLASLGERYADPVFRSIARHLARTGPPAPDPKPITLDSSATTSSEDIAQVLRSAPRTSLDGLSAQAIWEALALLAIDARVLDNTPSGAACHQTTLLDALWNIHDRADPEQHPRILARAVHSLVELQAVRRSQGLPSVELNGAAKPNHEDGRYQAALVSARRDSPRFFDGLRRELAMKGTMEHDFKYFAAVEAVAQKLSPALRYRWLAAAALAHPIGSSERWDRSNEAAALIQAIDWG